MPGFQVSCCSMDSIHHVQTVVDTSVIELPELNPVDACRGFPTKLTPRGWPCCIVRILEECTSHRAPSYGGVRTKVKYCWCLWRITNGSNPQGHPCCVARNLGACIIGVESKLVLRSFNGSILTLWVAEFPAELYFDNDCQSWSIMIGTELKMQQQFSLPAQQLPHVANHCLPW